MNTTAQHSTSATRALVRPNFDDYPDDEFVANEMMRMGRTVQAMLSGPILPSQGRGSWPSVVHDYWYAYESKDQARARASAPTSRQIDHLDFWNRRLTAIAPRRSPYTQKVVIGEQEAVKIRHVVRMRSLIDPIIADDPVYCDRPKKMHLFGFEEISNDPRICTNRHRVKVMYDTGIGEIVSWLRSEGLTISKIREIARFI